MPASVSNGGGGGGSSGGGGSGSGKSTGQGSFRKIGGTWRRVGGWGGKGGKGDGSNAGDVSSKEDKEQKGEPATEEDMDAPLPQLDHERCASLFCGFFDTLVGPRGNQV